MRPHRAARLTLALTLGLAAAGTGIGTATPAASAEVEVVRSLANVVSIFGETGDPVTGGKAQVWESGRDTVTATRVDDGIRVVAKAAGGEQFDFRLQARLGDAFTYGTYPDSTTTATDRHGALDIVGGGRSCDGGQSGEFKILDVTPDLTRLWILFEQRCAGAAGSSFGEIRINQDNDPALLVAPARLEFPNKVYASEGTTVPITLVNTGSEPITFQSVEIAGRPTRTTANPAIDEPLAIAGTLSFTVAGTTCGTLAPGERCVVMVTYRPLILGPVEANLRVADAVTGRHQMYLAGFSDSFTP